MPAFHIPFHVSTSALFAGGEAKVKDMEFLCFQDQIFTPQIYALASQLASSTPFCSTWGATGTPGSLFEPPGSSVSRQAYSLAGLKG